MDRADWTAWRDAPKGKKKAALLAKLLADNDNLAHYYVTGFSRHSAYYTENMQEDLLQAARIGIMRALPAWDPDKGGFSSVGYWWARHEMQLVARHASRISVPKSAFLPKAKQDEIAKFEAMHGRAPAPEEVGLTQRVLDRARMATVEIVDVSEVDAADVVADTADGESPEENIDRKRDIESLKVFVKRLSAKDRREFWAGERPDITALAKTFVEARRGVKGTKGRK
jgi:RNA polymerase sigma factor (sigma-70 family)